MRPHFAVPAGLFGAGIAVTAYASLVERNMFTLRRFDVPVLEAGSAPLRLLHISDLHMTAGQRRKQEWVRRLDELDPDLVITTGDNLAGHDAVAPTLWGLAPLLERPGAFVLGSNDYWAPRPKNPLKYFWPNHRRVYGARLPWQPLRDGMTAAGWLDLDNARGWLKVDGRQIALAGVNDPHHGYDRYGEVSGEADPQADVRIGLTHSPEPRIVNAFAADGYDLVLAGHTHGGQLRIPLYGALVTNCGIDRPRARWLHRWAPDTWLHISAGLGTSPYAPARFACPPEATLLTLVAKSRVGPEPYGSPAAR
ncbi:MAG: metallophosphoesterase [Actinomycetota bacterium]|nr:metallophosphoesterase [Actinomycetota bacterium]